MLGLRNGARRHAHRHVRAVFAWRPAARKLLLKKLRAFTVMIHATNRYHECFHHQPLACIHLPDIVQPVERVSRAERSHMKPFFTDKLSCFFCLLNCFTIYRVYACTLRNICDDKRDGILEIFIENVSYDEKYLYGSSGKFIT